MRWERTNPHQARSIYRTVVDGTTYYATNSGGVFNRCWTLERCDGNAELTHVGHFTSRRAAGFEIERRHR